MSPKVALLMLTSIIPKLWLFYRPLLIRVHLCYGHRQSCHP